MKKIFFFILLILPLKVSALNLDIPELYSDKAIVYDLTAEELLYEKNGSDKTPIASLTKILTCITAIELIPDLEEEIVITKAMISGIHYNASVAGLKEGDIVTYKDLLYASMLPSGADATQALAITLTGSISNFVLEMNVKAKEIGMDNSNFLNTSGLDISGQYSTTNDTLTLLRYALENATFKEVFTTKEYTLTNGLEVKSTLKGYEENSGFDISRIKGGKTGYTDYAGVCLASLVEVKKHDIAIITIKAPYVRDTFYNLQDHLTIINYLDSHYEIESIDNYFKEEQAENINNEEKVGKDSNNKIIILSIIGVLLIILLFYKDKKGAKR